jgi:hypothetical protein
MIWEGNVPYCSLSSQIMKIECSSGSWQMRLGLTGPVVQHGTLQPRILYRPPASLLWLIVQRRRKCVASGRVRSASAAVLGRPGAAVPTRQIPRWSHGKAEIF